MFYTSGIDTVILKEDKMEASQSRGNRDQAGSLRLLRTDFTYWVLFADRLSDTV